MGEKRTMQIHGPSNVHGAQPINAPHRSSAPQATPQTDGFATVDQLDISREADMASRLQDIPDIRTERVAAIRAQIEAGTYETEDKLDSAVSRLLDEIG
jgi:anti-sigma28 factor (negative regulator of flagellin synthesis)